MRTHNNIYTSNTEDEHAYAAHNAIAGHKSGDLVRGEDLYQNRNLSDIVSRIQDDGPVALRDRKKTKKFEVHRCVNTKPVTNISESEHVVREASQTKHSDTMGVDVVNAYADQDKPQETVHYNEDSDVTINLPADEVVDNSGNNYRGQKASLVIMFVTIIAMAYFIYQLQIQSDAMVNSLDEYSEYIPIIDHAQTQSRDIIKNISSLKSGLAGLREELKGIEYEFVEFDQEYTLDKLSDHDTQLKEIVAVKDEIIALQDTLIVTQLELAAMNALKASPHQVSTVNTANQVAVSGWVVNLASFSSLDQAELIAHKLQSSDMVAVIQEAVVNGLTVFRLSVNGFSSVEEAMVFVGEAREKHGFPDAWVRPG